jgi:uncharacterized glyoxalase superfamily protein PhnB
MTAAAAVDHNVEQAVPFFWVRDINVAIAFYIDGLGFTRTIEWRKDGWLRWCWLRLGGASMMLQEFWESGPNRNATGKDLGVGVSINFVCKDAVALYREFRSRGIDAKRPFVGNGMWVTHVRDPDGYNLYFESPTDAPEESELPE